MMPQRITAILLAMMLLFSCAAGAEQLSAEEQAEDIFRSLTNTFDTGLNYLKHRQALWSSFVEASGMSFPEDMKWFWYNHLLLGSTKMAFPISWFYYQNIGSPGSGGDAASNQLYDMMYTQMFLPLYRKYGETKAGFQKACFAMVQMVFFGDSSLHQQEMEKAKGKIKALAQQNPDYEYNASLKTFYKECLQLLDYIADSSDSYTQTKEQISAFEQKKRELRSEFDFDFTWEDLSMDHIADMSDAFYTVYHPDADEKYLLAKEKSSNGDLLGAFNTFKLILGYRDSIECYDSLLGDLYRQALEYESREEMAQAAKIYQAIKPYMDSAERYEKTCMFLPYPIRLEGFSGIKAAFFHGLAPVKDMNNKWGFVNTAGETAIDCRYDNVTDFWYGYSTVTVNVDDIGKKGVIDPEGNYIVPIGTYDDIGTFSSDGLCGVKQGDKWGYIDTSGSMVIPARYDGAVYFNEGYAAVKVGDLWGAIDATGRMIIEPQFKTGFLFQDGIAAFRNGGRYIYIDTAGKQLFGTDYADAKAFGEGLAACRGKASDDTYQCIDKNGHAVFSLESKTMGAFQEGLNWFRRGNLFGFVDKTGREIISPEYSDFWFVGNGFHDGFVAAKKGGRWGIIDQSNKAVVPFEYDYVYAFNGGYAIGIKDTSVYIFEAP